MYPVKPPHVFVHKRVYSSARAVARMERMLAAMGNPPTKEVDVGDTERVLGLAGPRRYHEPMSRSVRMGLVRPTPDASVLFNTFVWDEAERTPVDLTPHEDHASRRIARLMAGVGDDFAFSRRDNLTVAGVRYVCQGGWGLHSLQGCMHKCAYCYEGFIHNIMLDLEDFADHVFRVIEARPEQRLYRYDMYSDSICLEPEYGASALLSERFARTGDKYLLYYTKSDNVDHLLDLPHEGHTIINWSMSCDTVSKTIERNTPDVWRRIKAAEKCQKAGYTVRGRFSPIVPIKGWREEYADTIREYLSRVKPDVITLDVLGWMGAASMRECFDVDSFDPEFRNYFLDIERQGDPKRGKPYNPDGKQFFSHELRSKVYRFFIDEIRKHAPEQRISICMETPEMWEEYGAELGMSPENYVCCCGPTSVPGNALLAH